MKYLLDTNVVSEAMKAGTDPAVTSWMASVAEGELALSVIAVMEVRRGIEMMPSGRRRQRLEEWLTGEVPERFAGRILGIDRQTADLCGSLLGRHRLGTNVRRIMDIWLAAIALQHDLTLVTRNERDFRDLGVEIVNPWTAEAP